MFFNKIFIEENRFFQLDFPKISDFSKIKILKNIFHFEEKIFFIKIFCTYQDVSELGFPAFLRPLEQKYKSKSEIVFFFTLLSMDPGNLEPPSEMA